MSSMNLLLISDANVAAAEHLEQDGDLSVAKDLFSSALHQLQQFALDEDSTMDKSDVTLSNGMLRSFGDTPLRGPYSSSTYSIECGRGDVAPQQDIYSSVFLLAADVPLDSEATTAILAYNLGLVYHLEGLEVESAYHEEVAVYMYQTALCLLDHHQESVALTVLEAALCYNLSRLYETSALRSAYDADCMMGKLQQVVRRMKNASNGDQYFFRTCIALFEGARASHLSAAA